MPGSLLARYIKAGDGERIATMMQRISPLHVDVLENLEERIELAIGEECVVGVVVERIGNHVVEPLIVGVTMLGFVKDGFVEQHFAAPTPCLSSSLMRSVDKSSIGHFMSRKEQAEANLGDGMHQAIVEFSIEPLDMHHPDFAPIMNELFSAYFKFERGYNIKGVFVEADQSLDQLVVGTGLRPVCYFDLSGTNEDIVIPPGIGSKRCLYRVLRQDKPGLSPGSAAFILLTYIKPTFKFTPTEQRLLAQAIDGKTDDEIARNTEVSRDAIKQNWRTIYDHVLDVMPDLLWNADDEENTSRRGTEKRRRIVSHVSNNLQELRPHYMRRG
jgi:DNA-binding CsgD family transcriptional regulator